MSAEEFVERSDMTNNKNTQLPYFLAGLVTGAALAALMTPYYGAESRRAIGSTIRDGKDRLKAQVETGQDHIKARAEEFRESVKRATDQSTVDDAQGSGAPPSGTPLAI
jgi:hypothetical protein